MQVIMSTAPKKNPAAVSLGKRGGRVISDAKRAAAQKNLRKARKTRWTKDC